MRAQPMDTLLGQPYKYKKQLASYKQIYGKSPILKYNKSKSLNYNSLHKVSNFKWIGSGFFAFWSLLFD